MLCRTATSSDDSSAKFRTLDQVYHISVAMNDRPRTFTHAKNVQMKDAQLAIAIDITNLSMQSLVKLLKSRLILNRNIN